MPVRSVLLRSPLPSRTITPCTLMTWLILIAGPAIAFAQTPTANPLDQLSASIRELTRRVSPAVVEILVTGYGVPGEENGRTSNEISRQKSSGSGVLVDSSGYIMTNAHVIQGAVSLKVLVSRVNTPGGAPSP